MNSIYDKFILAQGQTDYQQQMYNKCYKIIHIWLSEIRAKISSGSNTFLPPLYIFSFSFYYFLFYIDITNPTVDYFTSCFILLWHM